MQSYASLAFSSSTSTGFAAVRPPSHPSPSRNQRTTRPRFCILFHRVFQLHIHIIIFVFVLPMMKSGRYFEKSSGKYNYYCMVRGTYFFGINQHLVSHFTIESTFPTPVTGRDQSYVPYLLSSELRSLQIDLWKRIGKC